MKRIMLLVIATTFIAVPLFAEDIVIEKTPNLQKQVYAVIFGIIIDENGKLSNLRISKVINASSGSQESVNIKVSKEYFENAKIKIENKQYEPSIENGKPKEFFTYFYLDLERPTVVIDDVKQLT